MTYFKNSILVMFIMALSVLFVLIPSKSQAIVSTSSKKEILKTKELKYRFSPKADRCYVEGSKEFKKLYQNRVYKSLADCVKKLKNKSNGQVLGVKEKKGGVDTRVKLIISEK